MRPHPIRHLFKPVTFLICGRRASAHRRPLTVRSSLGQVVVSPERADGLDHVHDKVHVAVHLVAVPAELQTQEEASQVSHTHIHTLKFI